MSELRLDGNVAIVTGAGRGLGREYALMLASRGAAVIVNDLGAELDGAGEDARPANQVVAEIEQLGGKAVANFSSVTSEAGARTMVEQALNSFGALHTVINNAGNFTPSRPFLETSAASFQSLWDVHVLGAVNVLRAAWPHFLAQNYGRVVNIGSHGGYYGHAGRFEYATVKAALHGLTLTLAMEANGHDIGVNVVAPGAATRPVLSWAKPGQFSMEAFSPALVAPPLAWLVHPDCKENGQSFSIMSGNISRVVVCETKGYQSRTPTPEQVRAHFPEIMDIGDTRASNLSFPEGAVARGAELIAHFTTANQT